PLCNFPVAISPGQEPTIRMERHFHTECPGITGRKAKSGTPTCARPKCGTEVLFSPIGRDVSNQQFCLQHSLSVRQLARHLRSSHLPRTHGQNVSNKTSAASAAVMVMAAVRRPAAAPNKPSTKARGKPQTSAPAEPVASSAKPKSNPKFSATERRVALVWFLYSGSLTQLQTYHP
ncbi:hypothetical protein C8Q76DRAFT_608332, partial [Earliella scabrosa]